MSNIDDMEININNLIANNIDGLMEKCKANSYSIKKITESIHLMFDEGENRLNISNLVPLTLETDDVRMMMINISKNRVETEISEFIANYLKYKLADVLLESYVESIDR